jgi:uncharacterized protein with HEPN domain
MRDSRERLRDILDAIDSIERYSVKGKAAFDDDELIQTWIVHHLQIIGEAASKLDPLFQESHSNISWSQIIAMRNILIHDYFGVDRQEIWITVERDLSQLKKQIQELLSE